MRPDPIELEVFKHLFHAVAEEMGAALRRTAFSPNIKERRDYSCALFDAAGNALAMGDHMPVHLGSMPMSVRAAIADLHLAPGDVAMLNDPFRGGTHLPDITVVAPVFIGRAQHKHSHPNAAPDFFVAARAHHADVGGAYAGSMGLCREIYQEGFRIPPVKIVRAGTLDRDILALLLNNVRTPQEREGDLSAQLAACHTGSTRLIELCARYGLARAQRAARALLDYSEKMMRAFLATVPPGSYTAEDVLDDDGVRDEPVRIAVRLTFPRAAKTHASKKPQAVLVDFTGSSPQVEGSINAVEAITYSACFYVFRCLLRDDVPATAGLMRPIQLIAPQGTVVNARPPAAVAGGNVETSQRIVDALLRALAQALPQQIPAASSGTMNNLTIGGMDDRPAARLESLERVSVMALEAPRLRKPLKKSASERFVSGSEHSVSASERFVSGSEHSVSASERFVSGSEHSVSASERFVSGSEHSVSASKRFVSGSEHSVSASERFVSGREHSVSASERFVSGSEHSVPASERFVSGREHSVSASERFVSGREHSVSAGERFVSGSEDSVSACERFVSGSEHSVSASERFVSGHDFSRADNSFFSCHPEEGFSPTRDPRFRLRNLASRSSLPLAGAGPATPFAYYETIAGGSGASAAHDGVSGVHTHMTNSLNTPAEALEYSYPLRVTKYALRAGSGGMGVHRGGDGIIREIEVLTDATVTLLSDRRKSRPYGLAGGEPGAPGRTVILRKDGSTELMSSKGSTRLQRGERIRIETPGGGGWGTRNEGA
jgi:N-methylhydantoinase B